MDNGWISLHRKIRDNPIWKNSQLLHLFLELLLQANHQKTKFLWNGKEQELNRGQLLTGRLKLAEATGISPNSIKDYLITLGKLGITTNKSTNKFTIITILKYSQYQDRGIKDTSKFTSQTPTKHQPDTTYNNDNNDNNETKDIVAEPPEVNLLLDFFKKTVNSHINFGNKTERKACADLLKAYGLEKVKSALVFLEERRKTDKYLPLITTPYELWTKWAKIKQHLTKKKGKVWTSSSASQPWQRGQKLN